MSTTKYRCVNCDHIFEVGEEGAADREPRCPKCHRVHDVVRVAEPSSAPWYRRNTTLGAAALLGIVGLGVVVYALRQSSSQTQPPAAPVIPAASRDELAALVGKLPGFAEGPVLTGAAAGTPEARARALGKAMRGLVDAGALKVLDAEAPVELAERELVDPPALLQKIGAGAPTVTSLEAALLTLRMARATGLQAEVVRVERYGSAQAPADPSGLFGHYAVAVHGVGPELLLDSTLAGGVAQETAETKPVSDAACGGILEAYRALQAFIPTPESPKPNALAASEHIQKAKALAADWAPVRMAAAFVSMADDPGKTFAEADALLHGATPSEKVAVAELYVGLGRVKEVEQLLDEAARVYPAWARIPLVRAQLALFRAGVLVMARMARSRPDALTAEQAAQLAQKLRSFGVSESDPPETQFALIKQNIQEAERLGGSRSTARLRELYAVAVSDYRLGSGDIDGARKVLEEALRADPASPSAAVPLAAILLAQGDEPGARAVLEPAVPAAHASLDDLLQAARSLASRIRAQAPSALPPGGGPFDLSAPPGSTVPSTEPTLQMPNLGGRHGGGLGQGLQLRF